MFFIDAVIISVLDVRPFVIRGSLLPIVNCDVDSIHVGLLFCCKIVAKSVNGIICNDSESNR